MDAPVLRSRRMDYMYWMMYGVRRRVFCRLDVVAPDGLLIWGSTQYKMYEIIFIGRTLIDVSHWPMNNTVCLKKQSPVFCSKIRRKKESDLLFRKRK